MERLRELGHELRRPEADLLRDGIYELRASLQGVHHRILYFRHGAIAAVVAPREIDRAIERKKRFEANPAKHRHEEARANQEIARKILGLRTKAGLTQAQLGPLVGTTASVICRLEDADYEGQSLAMLRRIAAALNQRVEIRFVPIRRSA